MNAFHQAGATDAILTQLRATVAAPTPDGLPVDVLGKLVECFGGCSATLDVEWATAYFISDDGFLPLVAVN